MGRNAPAEPRLVNCRWWKRGHCRRGDACYFRHDPCLLGIDQKPAAAAAPETQDPQENTSLPGQSHDPAKEPEQCAICLEVPKIYGLMIRCDHVFCLACIRQWRDSKRANKDDDYNGDYYAPSASGIWGSKTIKSCPLCRKPSKYIIPSAVFPTPPPATENAAKGTVESEATTDKPSGKLHAAPNPLKESIVEEYTRSMKRIPCRYFERGVKRWETKVKREAELGKEEPPFRPICFFENKCHYAHIHPITKKPYIFEKQQIAEMNRKRLRRRDKPQRWGSMDDSLFFLAELEAEFTGDYLSNQPDAEWPSLDSPGIDGLDEDNYWEDWHPSTPEAQPNIAEMGYLLGYHGYLLEDVL